jgi:hypothetical protein
MGRRIVTSQLQASGGGQKLDTYFDKLIKYIPADLVAAWTAVSGLIAGAADSAQGNLLWIVFLVGLVLTPLWTWRQTQEPGLPPAVTQIVISTLAFAVWIFALGGPFSTLDWYQPLYGSLVLIGFTLVVPLLNPSEG